MVVVLLRVLLFTCVEFQALNKLYWVKRVLCAFLESSKGDLKLV